MSGSILNQGVPFSMPSFFTSSERATTQPSLFDKTTTGDFVNLIWPRGDVLKWPRRGVGSMWGAVCCQAQQEVGSSLRKRFAVRRMPSAMVRYGAHVSASWVTVNPALMA